MSIRFLKNGNKNNMKLFIQSNQPIGFSGIWIQSSSFNYTNIVEIDNINQLMPSSINIIRGSSYKTVLFNSTVINGLNYQFDSIYLTDENTNILNSNIRILIGNGSIWEIIQEYTELEYIESRKNQYINTEIYASNKTSIELKFKQLSQCSYAGIFGGRKSYKSNGFAFCNSDTGSSTSKLFQFYQPQELIHTNNSYYNVDTLVSVANGILTLTDGTNTETYTHSAAQESFTTEYPIGLFAVNNSGSYLYGDATYGYNLRVYYCKLWEDGVLVRHLIPVKKISNGEVCMFDKISQTFFTNIGTGSFVAGPEI